MLSEIQTQGFVSLTAVLVIGLNQIIPKGARKGRVSYIK